MEELCLFYWLIIKNLDKKPCTTMYVMNEIIFHWFVQSFIKSCKTYKETNVVENENQCGNQRHKIWETDRLTWL